MKLVCRRCEDCQEDMVCEYKIIRLFTLEFRLAIALRITQSASSLYSLEREINCGTTVLKNTFSLHDISLAMHSPSALRNKLIVLTFLTSADKKE